jgi:predicted DNA-binding protein
MKENKSVSVTFRISEETATFLDAFCDRHGMGTAQVLRQAIDSLVLLEQEIDKARPSGTARRYLEAIIG